MHSTLIGSDILILTAERRCKGNSKNKSGYEREVQFRRILQLNAKRAPIQVPHRDQQLETTDPVVGYLPRSRHQGHAPDT